MRSVLRCTAGLALAFLLGAAGCAPAAPGERNTPAAVGSASPLASPSAASPASVTSADPIRLPGAEPAEDAATFIAVIDGDTIETSEGTVRIIGIDTPEQGECGHAEASMTIGRLLSPGDPLTLALPDGQNDRDQHGRLIRYVITATGIDLGLTQLEAGNAIARYDSTDGYPEHPRQAAYRAAQIASPGPDGLVLTTVCQSEPMESAAPLADDTATEDPWWVQYPSCSRLKKNTVGHPTGPFRETDPDEAAIYNWFASGTGNRGDGDGDGLACE